MESSLIDRLSRRIQEHRAGKGIREAAREVGVSPATLSRVENGKVPDLETFSRICRWLGDNPDLYLGTNSLESKPPSVRVHFKKGAAIEAASARALSEMILAAHRMLNEEGLD